MTPEMDSEFEIKLNVIPFNALGVAIWAPFSPSNSHASLRADVVVSRPEPEGEDPPADAKLALMEMGASYQLSSFANHWNWKEPKLDALYGALNSEADAKSKKPYWVEIDFQAPSTVY